MNKVIGKTMNIREIQNIATILHTIFCGQEHEEQMELYQNSSNCTFYLETSIDRCWELKEHKDWIEQAELFVQLTHPLSPIEILQDLAEVHKITTKIKNINIRLLDYIKIIIK